MKIIFYPTNFVSVWLIWGWRMLVTKIFDLDLRMIELWAKICTLRMGQKLDITLDLPLCNFLLKKLRFQTKKGSQLLAHRTNITWRCEKRNFRNCYAKRCHGNHTYQGKIISFSFSFCSFYPIGMKFGTQDRYNMALWKIEFSEVLRQALPWQPHISAKIIIFSFINLY